MLDVLSVGEGRRAYVYRLETPDDDASLRLVAANRASAVVTGLAVDVVVGKTIDENFPGLRALGIPQIYASVARDQVAHSLGEVRYKDARLREAVYLVRAVPLVHAHVAILFENMTSERRMAEETRAILDSAHNAFVMMNPAGLVTRWNREAERTFGWTATEAVGTRLADMIVPENLREAHARGLHHFVETGDGPLLGRRFETPARCRDGREVHVEMTIVPIPTNEGHAFASFLHDISERKAREEALRQAEERLRLTFDLAPIGMALVSLEGKWMRSNQALSDLLGYSSKELQALTSQEITHPEDLGTDLDLLGQLVRGEIPRCTFAKRYIKKDSSVVDAMLHVALVRDEAGVAQHFISQIEDVTEKKRLAAEVLRLALTDSLTGFLVRGAGEQAIARERLRAARYKFGISLALFDVDHFKRVNDTHGHAAGDAALRAISRVMRSAARDSDILIRWGGEELLAVLPHADLEGARAFAERSRALIAALSFGSSGSITASAGTALIAAAEPFDDAVARADAALYQAKRRGRNCVV